MEIETNNQQSYNMKRTHTKKIVTYKIYLILYEAVFIFVSLYKQIQKKNLAVDNAINEK